MTEIITEYIGIDICKAHLDVAVDSSGEECQFTNDKKGHKALVKWLGKMPVKCIIFEATGPYHLGLERCLGEHGLAFSKVNPRQAKAPWPNSWSGARWGLGSGPPCCPGAAGFFLVVVFSRSVVLS